MKHFLLVLCILSSLYSCNNEKKINQDYLLGKWVIVEASRNDKKTNTLDGAFFFFQQKVLTTNFQGFENQAEYTLANNELKLTKGLDYSFHLHKTEDQFLVMSAKIQNATFLFKLKKE
jgi:hypothetical protein